MGIYPAVLWAGAENAFLDQPDVTTLDGMVLGRYGGRRDAGACKNEDAAFLRADPRGAWEIAAVADGHAGDDSLALAVQLLEDDLKLPAILGLPVGEALPALHTHLLGLFQAADTSALAGETAVLVAARRDRFVLAEHRRLHAVRAEPRTGGPRPVRADPALVLRVVRAGGQPTAGGALPRQRSARPAARTSRIALITDGLLEFGERPYVDGARPHGELAGGDLPAWAARLMQTVHSAHGADSATLLTWEAHAGETPIHPMS